MAVQSEATDVRKHISGLGLNFNRANSKASPWSDLTALIIYYINLIYLFIEPPFSGGLHSGFMMAHVTASALVSENKGMLTKNDQKEN